MYFSSVFYPRKHLNYLLELPSFCLILLLARCTNGYKEIYRQARNVTAKMVGALVTVIDGVAVANVSAVDHMINEHSGSRIAMSPLRRGSRVKKTIQFNLPGIHVQLMRNLSLSWLIFGVTTLTILAASTVTLAEPLDARCEVLGNKPASKMREAINNDYTLLTVTNFYSPTLDACIQTEVAEVGVSFLVRDLTYSLMRDGGNQNVLLNCDADGADSAIVEKVRQFRGHVERVPYVDWMDDGFGGTPRCCQKNPAKLYTRADCKKVFDKWMRYLTEP